LNLNITRPHQKPDRFKREKQIFQKTKEEVQKKREVHSILSHLKYKYKNS